MSDTEAPPTLEVLDEATAEAPQDAAPTDWTAVFEALQTVQKGLAMVANLSVDLEERIKNSYDAGEVSIPLHAQVSSAAHYIDIAGLFFDRTGRALSYLQQSPQVGQVVSDATSSAEGSTDGV